MGEDAGVDVARLLHLVARRQIGIDAVDPHRTRIVKRHQEMFRGYVRVRWMGRVGSYRCPVRVSAPLAGSMKGGDVMLVPAVPGRGALLVATYR